ncbi:MAG: T9SS type A sorting domain-containing protein, partial [Bacteroidetes bacterium]|nr:T9SS type A sorting domain-containing protein [Bacteroidota bacterium]
NLENGNDYVYLEASTGGEYEVLATFTGQYTIWTHQVIYLQDYLGAPWVSLRFRLVSDNNQVDDGMYLDDFQINVNGTGISSLPQNGWGLTTRPNPFSQTTEISFVNREPGIIQLEVYNATGTLVKTLCDHELSAGRHRFLFDGSDLSSGLYFYRLTSASETVTGKMMLSGR